MPSNGRKRPETRKCEILHSGDRIQLGETVTVLRFGRETPPYIEGNAVVVAALAGNRYAVKFLGDVVLRTRLVRVEFQADPEKILSLLAELWEAEQAMTQDVSDFFPAGHD